MVVEQSFVAHTFGCAVTRWASRSTSSSHLPHRCSKESTMHRTYTVATAMPAGSPHASMVSRPTHAMFVRRRFVVLVFLATLVLSFGLAARHGLADRGDGPASISTAGRASSVSGSTALASRPPGVLADGTYLVQPGDSLWTIAARLYHGPAVADYVDALVALHGGTVISPGEHLRLP